MEKCYTMQMPTQKKRINITIDDATYAAIERLADEREESISRTSLRLIEEALEFQEDRYFSKASIRPRCREFPSEVAMRSAIRDGL